MRSGELDPAILLRARRGDPPAFRALYQHHADAVYGFLVRILGEAAAAEDALQESFLRVLGALGRFDPQGPARLSTWIFTIARRVALNALERRRLDRRPAPNGQVPPPARQEEHDLRLELTAAVEALPDALRTTFVLRACCALSYEEVAAVEGVDLGTVKSRLHRARAALQASLRDSSDDDDERRRHVSRP
jgi:RNA polymerase sigma-70 factor, ECF subfamily